MLDNEKKNLYRPPDHREAKKNTCQVDMPEFSFKQMGKSFAKMDSACEKLKANKTARMNTVRIYLSSDCVVSCSGQCLRFVGEVLLFNNDNAARFVTSVRDSLEHGKGKNRNLIKQAP